MNKKIQISSIGVVVIVFTFVSLLGMIVWLYSSGQNILSSPVPHSAELHRNDPYENKESINKVQVSQNQQQIYRCYLKSEDPSKPLIYIEEKGDYTDLSQGILCYVKIHDSLPEYLFDISTSKLDYTKGYSVKGISVFKEGNIQEFVQFINGNDVIISLYKGKPSVLSFEDVNFDGFIDFSLVFDAGGTGNTSYTFYLFNPESFQFEISEAFSGLTSYFIDKINKTITTSWNWCAMCYAQSIYRVENNKLVFIESVEQDGEWDTGFTRVKKRLVDGVIATTSVEFIPVE